MQRATALRCNRHPRLHSHNLHRSPLALPARRRNAALVERRRNGHRHYAHQHLASQAAAGRRQSCPHRITQRPAAVSPSPAFTGPQFLAQARNEAAHFSLHAIRLAPAAADCSADLSDGPVKTVANNITEPKIPMLATRLTSTTIASDHFGSLRFRQSKYVEPFPELPAIKATAKSNKIAVCALLVAVASMMLSLVAVYK